jgi:hypothetical protein
MQEDNMDDINESMNMSRKQKRASIMRKYESKIENNHKNLVLEETVNKKAFSHARKIVRTRLAENMGAEYEKLGPTEKSSINRATDKKTALIRKIAARLIPSIQKAEQERLTSFNSGSSLSNYGQTEGLSLANEEVNEAFAKKFAKKDPAKANDDVDKVKIDPNGKQPNELKYYNKFAEEVDNNTPVFRAIVKKALDAGVDVAVLGEVFNRGYGSWNESRQVSQHQYAFARVNSFINQGKTYFSEDADLHSEEVKSVDRQPVVVPAHYDAYGNLIPAKTVMRRSNKSIIKSGNIFNGQPSSGANPYVPIVTDTKIT